MMVFFFAIHAYQLNHSLALEDFVALSAKVATHDHDSAVLRSF